MRLSEDYLKMMVDFKSFLFGKISWYLVDFLEKNLKKFTFPPFYRNIKMKR